MNLLAEKLQEPIFKGKSRHVAACLAGVFVLALAGKGLSRNEEPITYPPQVTPVGNIDVESQKGWVFEVSSPREANKIDCGSQGDFTGMQDNPKVPLDLEGSGRVVVCLGTGSDYPVVEGS